jgi:hypothetical protein
VTQTIPPSVLRALQEAYLRRDFMAVSEGVPADKIERFAADTTDWRKAHDALVDEIVKAIAAPRKPDAVATELRRAYLDGVIAKRGVYGDDSEWKVRCHELSEQDQRYWEERATLRYPTTAARPPGMLHPTEAIVTASELLAELEAVTAERDAEKERAAWSIRTADTRWRQLDAVRERVSVQLLSIDTLARNIAEYPDRIPLLIETIESLYERVQDGSIASLPTTTTTTAARPPEARGDG